MKHIDTTQHNINKIKKEAKKIKKEKGIKLHLALDEVSREFGYNNFNHVYTCLRNTKQTV